MHNLKIGLYDGFDVTIVKHDELFWDSVTQRSYRLRDDGKNSAIAGRKLYMTEKLFKRLEDELSKR